MFLHELIHVYSNNLRLYLFTYPDVGMSIYIFLSLLLLLVVVFLLCFYFRFSLGQKLWVYFFSISHVVSAFYCRMSFPDIDVSLDEKSKTISLEIGWPHTWGCKHTICILEKRIYNAFKRRDRMYKGNI